MIRRRFGSVRSRSGVTLTEILISILILGVGLVSLATLFPLGLLRLRTAQQLTRSTYMAESAIEELKTRNLLSKFSFTNFYSTPYVVSSAGQFYDPWTQDTPAYGAAPLNNLGASIGAAANIAPGLPVAYDPLWWNVVAQSGIYYDNNNPGSTAEGRFGSGLGFLRNNPTSGLASANGLQRLNNLRGSSQGNIPTSVNGLPYPTPAQQVLNYQTAIETFVSPEDIVFQDPKGQYRDPNGLATAIVGPSPVVPDLSQGIDTNANVNVNGGTAMALPNQTLYLPQNDWRYTWMLTGQQRDTINGSIFDVNIVVHENRPFGLDPVLTANGTVMQPTGETVVEAIWGYGLSLKSGFAVGASRTVLLLWPATQPDPPLKVGQWIADVTYERSQQVASLRYGGSTIPAQRCYWYQVAKRTEPGPATATVQGMVGGTPYRQMTVWTSTDLTVQSMFSGAGGGAAPVNIEAALIMPSVVNVIPRQVYTR